MKNHIDWESELDTDWVPSIPPLRPAEMTEFRRILEKHFGPDLTDQEVADAYHDAMTVIYMTTTADLRKEEKQLLEKAQEDTLESRQSQQLMKRLIEGQDRTETNKKASGSPQDDGEPKGQLTLKV